MLRLGGSSSVSKELDPEPWNPACVSFKIKKYISTP